jgi:hypothetical protein
MDYRERIRPRAQPLRGSVSPAHRRFHPGDTALFQRLLGFAAQLADLFFDLSVEEFSTSSRVSARDFSSARRCSDVVSFDMILSC